MPSKKNPRFFCDNCDAEVPADAKAWPNCGRFFSSVLCPSCGFAGEQSLFKDGCPSCGYSTGFGLKKKRRGRKVSTKTKPADPLPLWVVILSAAVFTGIIAALFFKFF
jgi:ssDNA-binding Zn-finger/Zn-ribbon topoisomerase 1